MSKSQLRHIPWLWLYRLFMYPLLWLGFWLLSFFNKKIAEGLLLRKKQGGVYPWLKFPKGSNPIWFHCSSMEFEYAKPVIREIKKINPNQKILVTYFSPSARKAVEGFSEVDFACPLPWDFLWVIKEFIIFHRPKMLVYARTDVWPEATTQCLLRNIPCYLFSATLAKNSSRLRLFNRGFTRWCYSLLNQIFCVSEGDKFNFTKAGINKNCQVLGDTRYDQVFHRLLNPKQLKNIFPKSRSDGRVVIFGSTWPEDEKVIFETLGTKKFENLIFVVVPHEITLEHLQSLSRQNMVKYSELEHPIKKGEILLVDQVGILAELYALADLAFVGGSFKKNVHSVMEPLAAGCLTLVGPNYENNREAIEFLGLKLTSLTSAFSEPASPVLVFKKAAQLSVYLEWLSKASESDLSRIHDEIHSLVSARKGASLHLIKQILANQI